MTLTAPNHYGGGTSETCSYSAAFHATHLAGKTSEALLNKAISKGEVGVLIGKASKGEIKEGAILFKGVNNSTDTIRFHGGQFWEYFYGQKSSVIDPVHLPNYVESYGYRRLGRAAPPVPLNSQSLGNLTDEDAAILFVKSKDEIAAAKGIPIQGANPALDSEVYAAIAKITGYTPAEINSKIAAYKATGKKLSSLKKQVLKNDALYQKALKAGSPTKPVAAASKPATQAAQQALAPQAPTAAYVPPKPAAANVYVPNTASVQTKTAVVNEVKQSVAGGVDYDEEDLVKAFIKAKDNLAADTSNAFNLYSKGQQFDQAMEKLVKSWGMDVKIDKINTAVANYVSSGKKISALKKKMISSGEMNKLAPTLKKTPVDKVLTQPATSSPVKAKSQIDEAVKVSDSLMDDLVDDDKFADLTYVGLKSQIANYKSLESNLEIFYAHAKKKNVSLSKVIKAYDLKKAGALKVENSNFYEKKMMTFLSTPEGRKYAKEKLGKVAPSSLPHTNVYGTQPTHTVMSEHGALGPDSGIFEDISTRQAIAMQNAAEPWTDLQKEALQVYTGSAYIRINDGLRRETDPGSLTVRQMDAAMRPLNKDILVRRGADLRQFGVNSHEELVNLVGKTATDKGYLSTSVGGREAFSGRALSIEIEAPKGTLGAYVDQISRHKGERELILARNTKLKILKVTRTSTGSSVVRVRVVDQHGN